MTRQFCIALALAFLATTALATDETAWQKSHRLEAAGKYAEASTSLNGLESGADASFVLSRRGWLAYLQGQYNEAISHYNRALDKNPRSLEARHGITLPLLAQQRWREAAVVARQIVAESAWDYTAHVRLLVAEEGQQDWRGLQEHAERLTGRYPSDATVWVYLARAHAWQRHVREAREAYGRVLDRYPGHLEATRYIANQR
ncbi:MAG: tetratricopeptide repeat protein [Rhodocyclaceae bacterium]|nr:tetratricopeptide repeat protein [Rhodocyclaceae bacterium]